MKHRSIKAAPVETDYPDTVMDHIISGKSPLTAWRIFRGMTEKQLAERYGTSSSLLQRMTENDALSDKTLDKFAVIFHCTRVQLRRPEGLVVEPHKVRAAAAKRLLNSTAQLTTAS
jgi:transcriptional regulator with XRE-family HTH domain